jgi:hypothetical protein
MRTRIPLLVVVLALTAPAAASARPAPEGSPAQIQAVDRVSPDARYGVPDPNTKVISVPTTEVVRPDSGFDWSDAAVGGGATLALGLLIGGAALTVRPRRAVIGS